MWSDIKMTDKVFTQTEIRKILYETHSQYAEHYTHGKMEFKELVLVENFMLLFERKLDEYNREDEDDD